MQQFGAIPINHPASPVELNVAAATAGKGLDIVYDTVVGAMLDGSFVAAKRYTGQAVSCLGWERPPSRRFLFAERRTQECSRCYPVNR